MEYIVKEYGELEMWNSMALSLCNCIISHPISERPPHWMKPSDDASELSRAQFWILDRCHNEDEDWGSRHGGDLFKSKSVFI